MIPLAILPTLLRALPFVAAAAALGGAYWLGSSHASAKAESRATAQREAHAKALASAKDQAQRVVTVEVVKYVDKIERLPGRTVVRDRIVSLCDAPSPADGLRLAGDPGMDDSRSAPDPIDRLADDLRAAQVNKARQAALAETMREIYRVNGQTP